MSAVCSVTARSCVMYVDKVREEVCFSPLRLFKISYKAISGVYVPMFSGRIVCCEHNYSLTRSKNSVDNI